MNVPLMLTQVSDAPALGAATLAAVGAGLFPTVVTAVDRMVHITDTIHPDPSRHAQYRAAYTQYTHLYPALVDWRKKNEEPFQLESGPVLGPLSLLFPSYQGTHTTSPLDTSHPSSVQVAASVLGADPLLLSRDVGLALSAGVDLLHVDLCDGWGGSGLAVGIPTLEGLRRAHSHVYLDVHLTAGWENARHLVPRCVAAGASRITLLTDWSEASSERGTGIGTSTMNSSRRKSIKGRGRAHKVGAEIDRYARVRAFIDLVPDHVDVGLCVVASQVKGVADGSPPDASWWAGFLPGLGVDHPDRTQRRPLRLTYVNVLAVPPGHGGRVVGYTDATGHAVASHPALLQLGWIREHVVEKMKGEGVRVRVGIDGGVKAGAVGRACRDAGADVLVVGTGLWQDIDGEQDMRARIQQLRGW